MRIIYLITSLFAALAFLSKIPAYGQASPNVEWQKTFGGDGYDIPFFGFQTKDGGYFLGGFSESTLSGDKTQISQGDKDFWLVKTDSEGNKQWDRTYGGLRDDESYTGKQTSDGGYIIGGNSSSGIGGDKTQALRGNYDIWILKLDSSGNKLWDKTFGGNESDGLNMIEQTKDGGYILAGNSNSRVGPDKSEPHRGSGDFWILKLDADGNKIWDKTYGGNGEENVMCVLQTTDGNYLLGGKSSSGINGDKSENSKGWLDFWIIKIDPNGNKIWDKTLGGENEEHLLTMQQTPDNGFILGGVSRSKASGDKSQNGFGLSDFWLVKVDANGNKVWDKTYGGPESDALVSVDQTADGGYILGGFSASGAGIAKSENSKGMSDFWVLKVDKHGNILWDKTIGGNESDLLFFLEQTQDNGFILAGESYSGISGDKTQAIQGLNDFWMIKLGPDLSTPDETSKIKVFPNPSKGVITLQFVEDFGTEAELLVFDFLGRKLFEKTVPINNERLSDKVNLPVGKGIYLMQIKAGENIFTQKIEVE